LTQHQFQYPFSSQEDRNYSQEVENTKVRILLTNPFLFVFQQSYFVKKIVFIENYMMDKTYLEGLRDLLIATRVDLDIPDQSVEDLANHCKFLPLLMKF
jgi:hypothetical protein